MISPAANTAAVNAEVVEEIRKAETAALIRRVGTVVDLSSAYPGVSIEPTGQRSLARSYRSARDIRNQMSNYSRLELAAVPESPITSPTSTELTYGSYVAHIRVGEVTDSLDITSMLRADELDAVGLWAEDMLDWDVHIVAPPPTATQRVTARMHRIGRDKPMAFDDTEGN